MFILVAYFFSMLRILVENRVRIKLIKKRLPPQWEYLLGIDVVKEGKKPEILKTYTLKYMAPPQLFCDWIMLKIFFGFYNNWQSWYK